MGFISSAVGGIENAVGLGGTSSNANGANFQAGQTNILQPENRTDVDRNDALVQNGMNLQGSFLNALGAQNGIGNQSSVYNQLQGVANGTGYNPAMAELSQQTGANVANQAALMAGQRGTGANAGLLARQAAMQGAATQQQAVGQGASLQANQSINALNSMGSIAQNQVSNLSGATNAYNSAAQNEQAQLLGSINNYNNANIAMQSNMNNANAGIANTNAQAQNRTGSSLLNAAGAAVSTLGGSVLPKLAHGGQVLGRGQLLSPNGPQSHAGQFFSRAKSMKEGGKVPGRASVAGNSSRNDTVPTMLSPGEDVLPRSVTMSKNPPEAAKKFVAALMAKRGMGK